MIMRVRHPQPPGVLVHDLHEGLFGAGHAFRERDGGIVARLHDHALDQDIHRDLRTHLDKGARAFRAPGVFADRDRVGELQATAMQFGEHDVGGHQLGETGRLHAIVRMIGRQHATGLVVLEQIGARGHRGRCGYRGGGQGRGHGSKAAQGDQRTGEQATNHPL